MMFVDNGVIVCFVNFGILEMYLVMVFDGELRICLVLCLFEGVVIGVVDGYVWVIGMFVMILFYFGVGYFNVGVNIYNVGCVNMLMINVIGDYVVLYL